jgi:hypothetical protein
LAAFLAALWWINRANGGGTGLEDQLPAFPGAQGFPPVAPVGGATFNIGGNTFGSTPSNADTCGCSTCPQSANILAFGSNENLAAYLATLGQTGTWQAGVTAGGWN